VVDIGSTEFRDPKVFWHEDTQRWVMLVVKALEQQVWFYTSTNLKDWQKVSTFGPAGSAVNNIWEVPDLFQLPVDGNSNDKRWVLVVSINRGSLWGGSGVQYFIGDFNGQSFTATHQDTSSQFVLPEGDLLADFEGQSYPTGWQTTGSAFGNGPAHGTLANQNRVSGYLGNGLVNSFNGGDGRTGTLTSAPFVLTKAYVNFLIGGGASEATRMELKVHNQVVHKAYGRNDEQLQWQHWDVSAHQGQTAVLRIVDESTGSWGHINVDHVMLSDSPVRTSSLASTTLWADYGRDFYAPLTFANMPDGRVMWLGWMSNWAYSSDLPTQTWRGQQSLPRELSLVSSPSGPRLRQRVSQEVYAVLQSQVALIEEASISSDAFASKLAGIQSQRVRLSLRFSAEQLDSPFELELLKRDDKALRVGFDPHHNTFYVDRSQVCSHFVGCSERHEAKRVLTDNDIQIEIWLDGSTVELFADDGTVVISDVVYPHPDWLNVGLGGDVSGVPLRDVSLRVFD
jgi:sucrose-6-phosphate hydrolase SacC (GH32 family)